MSEATEFGDELVVDTDLNNEDPAVESIDDDEGTDDHHTKHRHSD